jgi:hypothetical protein
MKAAIAALFIFFGAWSIRGLTQINIGVGAGAAFTMVAMLVWRTIKGWPEWWAKL